MPAAPSKSARKGGRPPLPYTSLYAAGLRLGLTASDLRTMPYGRLCNIVYASSWDGGDERAREATQADIDRMLG